MSLYKYKFIKDGEEKEETKEFANKAELYKTLRSEGAVIVSAEKAKNKKKSSFSFSFGSRVKTQEIITFAKNLSVMIDAGLSISRALSVLIKQSKNKKMTTILEKLNSSVNSGQTLSKSLENYPNIFSGLFVSMVKAGEESGKLSESLLIVASQLEKNNTLTKKVKGAMIYPAIIISLMIIIGIVLMIYMVPTLTETFRGLNIELPLPTRIIIAISDFLRVNIILTFSALVVLFFGSITALKTQGGKNFVDFIALHTPIIKNLTKELNSARTSRTLSSLISSGVDIVSAINITGDVLQNHYFKKLLANSAKKVETGELLSVTLSASDKGLYPVFVGEMLSVGEETGKMTEMLENIATYYEGEVDQKTKDLSTIIEPFLMILIGIVVGIFAVAMMLPTYSLVDAIQ
ncbi:MAG: type II secretion system F family protein [Candidatus Zambryskibacteria bacterium]|nr:type II secretion system F family protein [Candidatus Zambryskibacteria bacterium]